MIVIPLPTKKGLPQPRGPGARAEAGLLTVDDIRAASVSSLSGDEESAEEEKLGPSARSGNGFSRSVSMFQQRTKAPPSLTASSSRETSPSSSRSTPTQQTDATSTSCTPSSRLDDSIVSRPTTPRKGKRQAAQVVVEISPPFLRRGKSSLRVADKDKEDARAIKYDVPTDTFVPPFGRKTANAERDLARVWEAVAGARRIAVICGAGISVSSPANIPDFRSTAGLFKTLKEKHPNAGLSSGKDLFDARLFNTPSTQALFYSMISELKTMTDAAKPTTFHHLLKRLDLEGRLQRVYTQNIDGLEERAGLTFGLGETGDSTATVRALGKRKRDERLGKGLPPNARAPGAFARSKSDSALLFAERLRSSTPDADQLPMFPRTIPLHGSLSTLTCAVCNHKIYLSLASGDGKHSFRVPQRELSPDAPDQAVAALETLSKGQPVECVKCEEYEEVRQTAGLRSRGVGIMRVDVVLYNGQNDGGEQVGQCLQRDILGLRDPNETAVPESALERAARERKERKENKQRAEAASERASEEKSVNELLKRSPLQPIMEANSMEDALGAAFDDDDDGGEMGAAVPMPSISVTTAPIEPLSTPPSSTAGKSRQRAPRLKPLPPDLLIVAGTSLKVPGTKRVVREFAKACQARDKRYFPGDSDEEDSESEGETSGKRTTRAKAKSEKTAEEKDEGGEKETEDDEDEDEDDVNAPIRTILLNYDFPVPGSQWDGVFDVWVQGDVQQSALGLWEATKYPKEACPTGFGMRDADNEEGEEEDEEEVEAKEEDAEERRALSWAHHCAVLEEERKALKKKNRASPSASVKDSSTTIPTKSGSVLASKAEAKTKATGEKSQAKSASQDAATKKAAPSKKSVMPKSKSQNTTSEAKANTKKPVTPAKSKSKKGQESSLTNYMKGTKASSTTTATAAKKNKVK